MTHPFLLVISLALKEFLALLRDKSSRFVLIGPPIAQLLVFGYAANYDLDHISVAIYNEDRGAASREFISHIEGSPNIDDNLSYSKRLRNRAVDR